MVETQIDKGQIAFQTEGRLLQELGERLVASPQVALVELVKNSYDADAKSCHVSLDEHDKILVVRDDGAGMTFDQFSTRWMRIATSNKVDARSSPKFKRHLTGQKGIGRFAVRFLGQKLTLDSVAWDTERKCNTRLLAEFDWPGHNERNWRSSIAEENFPILPAVRHRGDNPMLNLPSNFQLVGAAFVQSTAVGSGSDSDLITSMDREGFLYNDAFEQFVDIVRGGVEFLAREDRSFMQREADRKAKDAARRTRADLRAAVDYIEKSPTLTRADKTRLVEEYSGLAQKVGEVEEYDREARRKLETMSTLGVVAGFMTHESARIVSSLKEAVTELQRLARKHPSLNASLREIEAGLRSLEAQLDYAKTFVDATQRGSAVKFKSAPQVKHILQKFGDFARERGIEIEMDIDPETEAPPMPITVYSGILLNL